MAKKPCRFAQSEKGTVAIVSAFVLSISLLLAAFAVDYGMLTLERREAQNMADIAAITAAANISNAERAASLALSDNGFANVVIHMDSWAEPEGAPLPSAGKRPTELLLERGRYAADVSRAPHLRFEFGGEPQNAVRVTMRKQGQLYFAQRLLPAPMIETREMAQASGRTAFSIGSRFAAGAA